ncbi:hypothetical protein N007_18120 [Alicyclobacillus acidoterrestris ATCC 49025]|nr:hypothetical protein N007_18120 [Alicyclobacillus acidoterrestris ATCC 49025]
MDTMTLRATKAPNDKGELVTVTLRITSTSASAYNKLALTARTRDAFLTPNKKLGWTAQRADNLIELPYELGTFPVALFGRCNAKGDVLFHS